MSFRKRVRKPRSALIEADGGDVKDYGFYYDGNGVPELKRAKLTRNYYDNVRAIIWSGNGVGAKPSPIRGKFTDLTLRGAATTQSLNSIYGRWGSNLWVGIAADVARVRASYGKWMGVWTGGQTSFATGGCFGSTLRDLYITDTIHGIYVEQCTRETHFNRAYVQATDCGMRFEWADPNPENNWWLPNRTRDIVVENFTIDMRNWQNTWWRAGYGFDIGNDVEGVTIKNSRIIGGKGILVAKGKSADTLTVSNVFDEQGKPVQITTY